MAILPKPSARNSGGRTVLENTLKGIESLKARLESRRPLKPEDEQRLWQKLRLEWNYNSNHIEGNTLTYGETYLLLVHDKTNGGHTMREFEEMKAHDLAVAKVVEWSKDQDRPLTEADVRGLNGILLKEPFWKEAITPDDQSTRVQIHPGEYKRQPNNVRLPSGGVFQFASVEDTPARMQALMEWFSNENDLHPIEKAAKFHHDFVLIHPFGDGNGRTARLVVNYILMSAGYMPLVIKSADKTNYLTALQLADAGDLVPLTQYLAEQERWALELGVKAAEGESLEEEEDWKKRASMLRREIETRDHRRGDELSGIRTRMFRTLENVFEPIASRLDEVIGAYQSLFYEAEASLTIVGPEETRKTFGHMRLGLAASRNQLLNELENGYPLVRLQLSYDLRGFKHGQELRRWFIVNWFIEENGMRLEFVPKEVPHLSIPYGATWEQLDHSFVTGIADWIQEGIQKKTTE